MVQIVIDNDEEVDQQLEIYKALNALPSKSMSVEKILKEYFKLNNMPKIKNGK
jgi:hypothetical protein